MAVLKIHVAPHPVLKKKAEPVPKVTPELQKLMDDMLETMYATNGIGLAAPQVGQSVRVLVIDLAQKLNDESEDEIPVEGAAPPEEHKPNPMYFVNPEITWSSEDLRVYNEGCLSVPRQYADVTRPDKIRLKYLDYNGKQQEIEADGLLATCLQHEMDHLNGILFIDHLSTVKRDMLLRKLKKYTQKNEEEMAESHVIL